MSKQLPAISSTKNVGEYLGQMTKAIEAVLPSAISSKALITAVYGSIRKQQKRDGSNPLLGCTVPSFKSAVMFCAHTGLLPDTPAQECHLIPFKDEVVWIPGYRGLTKLARQSGVIGNVEARVVYEKDEFSFHYGLTPALHHKPCLLPVDQRGPIVFFYAIVRYKDSTPDYFDVMHATEVDGVRKRSRAKDNGPWVTDYVPMGQKTVTKRALRNQPMSPELAQALELDEIDASGKKQPVAPGLEDAEDTDYEEETSTDRLAREMNAAPEQRPIPTEPDPNEPPDRVDVEDGIRIMEGAVGLVGNELIDFREKHLRDYRDIGNPGLSIDTLLEYRRVLDDLSKAQKKARAEQGGDSNGAAAAKATEQGTGADSGQLDLSGQRLPMSSSDMAAQD